MKIKAVSGIMLTLLLIGMLALAFNIQLAKASGTVYIRADGSVEGTDKIQRDGDVYTFTGNIYDEIVVERDNIVVDWAGYTVQGTGSGTGIDLSDRSNVTLKNAEVTNFEYGIHLNSSSNNVLTGNTVSNNHPYGIFLLFSINNTLAGNTASNNGAGILLWSSSNNTLTGNTASNNSWNFGVSGGYFNNFVDTSNTVDGKPIYYLIGVADAVYDAKTNAGTIYLINSNNVTIKDLTLTKNWHGVFFWNTTNSKIENVTASNNYNGIYLHLSRNNTLAGNTASNNQVGIHLEVSSNNVLTGNTASNNYNGIYLELSSNNNVLAGNTASNNYNGIYLRLSRNNVLFHNNLISNTFQAVVSTGYVNTWDDGYPSGGNYWSDYTGMDQNGDGIGDTPYVIDDNNQDYYPLMSPLDTIPPVAEAGPDQTVNEDTLVTFDGSGSWYNVGIVNYTWAFTDVTPQTLTGVNPTYTFTTPGVYIITLNVTDAAGNWDTDTVVITVLDLTDPIADAGPDQTVVEDAVVSFDAGDSSDNVGIINYEWDFGDENKGTGVTTTHTYTEPGNYTVTLTVKDTAGNDDTDSIVITVLLDTDGDGTPDTTDPDDDNDGMPDTWETENELNPLDAADASLDPDNDGLTNLEEYQEDTDPNVSDAQVIPGWILGAAAAVVIGIAAVATFFWRRRK